MMYFVNSAVLKMTLLWTLAIICAISQVSGSVRCKKKFPDNFLLGASTAAYQIEGAWNVDGRGQSMWDYYIHNHPDLVEDGSNADVTADSYHNYERDVEMLKHLGAKSYRFSIAWTRILPDGTIDSINPDGIIYYSKLINLLIANDIVPLVTLNHWDLPIGISKQGGWMNDTVVDLFGEYARIAFQLFGDRVKHWITVNEPFMHCVYSYGNGNGLHPMLIKSPGIGFYECGRNYLLAHARAYHIYDKEFRKCQGGEVGITLDMQWALPATDSKDDAEALEDFRALHLGQFLDPIFKGDYPQRLLDRIAAASARQGYPCSRLRPFTEEQKAYIKGTVDFVGINHYCTVYVYRNASVEGMYEVPSFDDDGGFGFFTNMSWPGSAVPVMREYAPGFYALLMYLKDTYDNPVVYITENGFPLTADEDLNDDPKIHYLRNYLDALLDAKAAGCNCRGYFVWSLLDTFEWTSGYKYKLGLYQVNFTDPTRARTARKSALVYKNIIRTGTIDFQYNPNPYEHDEIY